MAAARTYDGTRDCKHCGAPFPLRTDQARASTRGKFCSVSCSNSARTTRPLTLDDASLRRLYVEQQMTVREVAQATNQRWKRVMYRLRELGLTRPPGRHGMAKKRPASATYRRLVAAPPGMVVHHIDVNPLNNDLQNLAVVSKHRHSALHKELETLSITLYKKGLVTFSVETGYAMSPRLLALMEE